jgi:hypothetical protein
MTNDEADKIVKSFSRTLILVEELRLVFCPKVFPQSLLEYPKEKIQQAITNALNFAEHHQDKETAALIKAGLAELVLFIDDEQAYNENHEILGKKEYWELLKQQN